MIKIDSSQVGIEGTELFIKYPTGIGYYTQCGGIGCTHPVCEGFIVGLGNFGADIDDCKAGCTWLSENDNTEGREALASQIQVCCLIENKGWRYKISFDYNRIDELQEGWWPVKISGDFFDDKKHVELEGYIHTGNCD